MGSRGPPVPKNKVFNWGLFSHALVPQALVRPLASGNPVGTHAAGIGAACLLIPDIPGVWVRIGLDTTGFVQSCTPVSHRERGQDQSLLQRHEGGAPPLGKMARTLTGWGTPEA